MPRTRWGGSAAFWWWLVVLISVSRILNFAFRHLVISGASCYSCLWLELVPQVIMLASISRPGRLDLSWVSVSVQSTLCRQALLLQGRCPDIWCSNLPPDRSCVPLTRGLKIPWRVLWGPWVCPVTQCTRNPGAALDRKAVLSLYVPHYLQTQRDPSISNSQLIRKHTLCYIFTLFIFNLGSNSLFTSP